jgi:hypothetical protein
MGTIEFGTEFFLIGQSPLLTFQERVKWQKASLNGPSRT